MCVSVLPFVLFLIFVGLFQIIHPTEYTVVLKLNRFLGKCPSVGVKLRGTVKWRGCSSVIATIQLHF